MPPNLIHCPLFWQSLFFVLNRNFECPGGFFGTSILTSVEKHAPMVPHLFLIFAPPISPQPTLAYSVKPYQHAHWLKCPLPCLCPGRRMIANPRVPHPKAPLPKCPIRNHLGNGKRHPSQGAPWGMGLLRSVAIGETLYSLLIMEGLDVSIDHLCRFWWSGIDCIRDNRRCQTRCADCNLDSAAHLMLFETLYKELSTVRSAARRG